MKFPLHELIPPLLVSGYRTASGVSVVLRTLLQELDMTTVAKQSPVIVKLC
jgi:hypothetical protein